MGVGARGVESDPVGLLFDLFGELGDLFFPRHWSSSSGLFRERMLGGGFCFQVRLRRGQEGDQEQGMAADCGRVMRGLRKAIVGRLAAGGDHTGR
ncbi:MAG: hypothetical protein Ct9H300mP1_02380 [Planctomycetaceae bacterium]|nr:MAG: hypothetical protein Ct9H300mP1_02380 [Planctomycetaceae bacterium]